MAGNEESTHQLVPALSSAHHVGSTVNWKDSPQTARGAMRKQFRALPPLESKGNLKMQPVLTSHKKIKTVERKC